MDGSVDGVVSVLCLSLALSASAGCCEICKLLAISSIEALGACQV
jgi:hypothetical protein